MNNAQCKGSYVLGTACGNCPKCQRDANNLIPQYRAEIAELNAKIELLTAYDGSLALMPFEEWQTLSAETRARINAYGMKMETLQKEQRQWIPVSERLPEPNEHVFIYWQEDNEALRETGFYVVENGRQYWSSLDNAYPLNVTHWQPLPEPPNA